MKIENCKFNQSGFAPLFLILFAGVFIFFSVTILDRYWLKNPNQKVYLAQRKNPVVTSENRTDYNFPTCSEDDEDDPVECPLADEGDGVESSQLASAQ